MNPSHHSSNSSQVIQLVPARSGSSPVAPSLAGRIERLATLIGLTALIALAVLVGLRVLGLLFFRAEIAENLGEVARVGGFGSRITEWLTGPVSLILGLAFFSLVIRLSLAFLLPAAIGAGRIWGPATALLCLTGFHVFVTEAIENIRHVDMTEVNTAEIVWFAPEGDARIFYADHLDGKRRFWNRPGHTPMDRAMAYPVTEEVRRAWLEEARLEKERERAGEERRAAEADLEARQRDLQELQATLEKQKAEAEAQRAAAAAIAAAVPPREQQEAQPIEAGRRAQGESLPAAGALAQWSLQIPAQPAPVAQPAPALPEPPPVQTYPLIRGKVLNLPVMGDTVECWSDGPIVIAGSAPDATQQSLSPGQRIRIGGSDTIHAAPNGPGATRLFVQPVSPNLERFRQAPPSSSGSAPADAPGAGAPAQDSAPANRPAPAHPGPPPVQTYPLIHGKVLNLPVMGDTVECWSDGPIVIAGSAPKATQQSLPPGRRIRIAGSDSIHAAPNGPGATQLYLEPVSPNLERFRQAPAASSDTRRRMAGF